MFLGLRVPLLSCFGRSMVPVTTCRCEI